MDSSVYFCYTRFSPQYGGLVWSAEWPVLIESILFGKNIWPAPGNAFAADSNDRRTLDPQQILPGRSRDRATSVDNPSPAFAKIPAKNLGHYVWLAVFVLLVLERSVSYKNKKLSNG
jgi:hypothetical protein